MANLKFSVHTLGLEEIAYRLRDNVPKAEHAVAVQIQKDTEDYVPASGTAAGMYNRTQVRGNAVIYQGPYARYLYYGKVMVYEDPPYLRTRSDGKAVLSHYGQRKVPIDKDLKIKTHHHKNAQSHWFEASKAENLDKWIKTAQKAVTKLGDK